MLAIKIGKDPIFSAYMIHKISPMINNISITKEMSSADLVFQVLNNCGRKAIVVKKAAPKPERFVRFTSNDISSKIVVTVLKKDLIKLI